MSRIRQTKQSLLDRIGQLEAERDQIRATVEDLTDRVSRNLLAVAQVAASAKAQAEGLARCPEAQGAVALVLKEVSYKLACVELTLRRTAR